MTSPTIYHNPRCSKSREALAILREAGIEPVIIEYLKTPLDYEALLALRAHFSLKDFVRTNEACFKALGLSIEDEDTLLKAMVNEPKLMQRPIVTYQDKAIIGRPPERVLDVING